MKCFTATEKGAKDGIAITVAPFAHIAVGEAGRGRELARVGLGSKDFPVPPERLERCSVIKTEKGTMLIVSERSNVPAGRALVLVNVSAGYRGSTKWTTAEAQSCPDAERGDLYSCCLCGASVELGSPHSGQTYPQWSGTVIAEGHEAQGDAGNMGGHVVRLIVMSPGDVLRVRRQGRLYGANPEVIIRWDGEHLLAGDRDVVLSDRDAEAVEVIG